uniref:ORF3 n=1 Tax=Lepus torque teno virus 1 TaxID=2716318 RepID=A0A6G7NP32_9VIRU|nr:ORF3 [Lepus torque teno virus 1]
MGGYQVWSPSRCDMYRTYESDYDSSGILREQAYQRITQVPLRETDPFTGFCAFHCRETPGATLTPEELRDFYKRKRKRLRAQLRADAKRIRRQKTREAQVARDLLQRKRLRVLLERYRARRAEKTLVA